MKAPPFPDNEAERLQALQELGVLDTSPEERFDRLTRLAKQMFGVDIALVSLVDAERQWFKSAQGLDICETARDISFCGHAILGQHLLLIPDASQDSRFCDNPLVLGEPRIRFYAGAPLITSEGYRVGTFCIIDSHPRELIEAEQKALMDFARCVEDELNLHHEQSLRRQVQRAGQRAQEMLDAIPDQVFVMDRDGYFTNCQNRSDLLIPKHLLLGSRITDRVPAELAERTLKAITEALDTHRLVKFETPFELFDGPDWFEARFQRLNSHEVLLLIRNVTREKATQRRLTGVLEGTRIGTWEWNIQTGETVFNERWAEICGYGLEELTPVSIQTWLSLVHPQDLEQSDRLLQQHFSGEREFYDIECRVRHKKGHWVWVHDRGRVISRTDSGEPLMMYGTHADISGRKRTEHNAHRQIAALTTLNDVASSSELSLSQQLTRALDLGLNYLKLDLAIISEINANRYIVRWFSAPGVTELEQGQSFSLGDTYCSIALQIDDVLTIPKMAESEYRGHPCYQKFGLESYIGVSVEVAGEHFGTLNFSSSVGRNEPFDAGEIMFMRLLARWVGAVLERTESQQKLHKLASQVPGMVYQLQRWPDGRSRVPYSSPGIIEIYGVTPEQVQDNASVMFERVHPSDLGRFTESLEASARQLSTWCCQYRLQLEQGEVCWVEGRASPEAQTDGSIIWHGHIHDISDQKLAEQGMINSEARLRGLFELSPLGIALNDFETGAFIEVNEALLAAAGYRAEELVGLRYQDLAGSPGDPFEWRGLDGFEQLLRFGPYEVEHRHRDGSRYPVVVNGMVVRDPLGRKLIWSFIEDITERKRIERMKNEFVSTVSHELRTPLTSIAASLRLVTSGVLGELPDRVNDMVHIASKNSQRLTYLINDLLDMEKLISGKLHFELQQQSLRPLIEQSLSNSETYAAQFCVQLELAPKSANPQVLVDPQRLEQVMANLLSNAAKFSPAGEHVSVSIEVLKDWARVSVKDRGPGVPLDFRGQIFQKFAQADASDSRQKGGSGLGLAISKELVEYMGGRIGYISDYGRETCFYFDLPVAEEAVASEGKKDNS